MKDRIIKCVEKVYDCSLSEINGRSRRRDVVKARFTLMYMLRLKAQMSFLSIARLVGDRHHSTVIHAVRSVGEMVEFGESFNDQDIDYINILKTLKQFKHETEQDRYQEYVGIGLA
jgi:chromosomal replication initiator protein